LQWLIDDADPIYQASKLTNDFIIQIAYMDSFVPNITNEIFSLTMGMAQDSTIIDENSEITTALPGKYIFKLTDGSPTPHAFLLYVLKNHPLAIKAQSQIGLFFQ
jgi:hypothetical protein